MNELLREGYHIFCLIVVMTGFTFCFLGTSGTFDHWTLRLITRAKRRRLSKIGPAPTPTVQYIQRVDSLPFIPRSERKFHTDVAYFLRSSRQYASQNNILQHKNYRYENRVI